MWTLLLIIPAALYCVVRSDLWSILRALPDTNDDLVYY